jgi:uncharacterized membrane protein YidH (DUF202 family)
MYWLTFAAAFGLATIHVFAGRLDFLHQEPRSKWLSAAGGIAVAYVFLHLLPELAAGQEVIREKVNGAFTLIKNHVYLLALTGLIIFYGLERSAKQSRAEQRNDARPNSTSPAVFWIHIVAFSLYNMVIGYLLARSLTFDDRNLLIFFVAMAFHFLVTDDGLREHHKGPYDKVGRWLLGAAVIFGWLLAGVVVIPEIAIRMLVALLAGGIILNVLKEELPAERKSRFSAFLMGAVGYTVIMLLL